MAENINSGGIYDALVPAYEEPADIQEALRLFLYGLNNDGSASLPQTSGDIKQPSIAYHLKNLQTQVTELDNKGLGSSIENSAPTGVENGYIWVDGQSSGSSALQYAVSSYQTTAPSSPATGTLWVKSDSSPLTMYVWSGTEWKEIGA